MSGTKPVLSKAACVSTSGIFTVIALPGLNPSARLKSVGSIGTPALFCGIASDWKSSRRPVSVEGSATVK